MVYKYVIPLETPAKKNSRITLKNGKTIPSKKYQQWHEVALLHLISQKRPENPINQPIELNLIFTHADRIRRDSDNGTSSILDLLQDARIIKDDNWQIVSKISIQNLYKKGNASAKIQITSI